LNAILGAALWVAFRAGWLKFYPTTQHGNLMIGGFLLSYAFGFLWTAIPRFFQAPMPRPKELGALITCMGATPVLGMAQNQGPFYLCVLTGSLLTLRFGAARFRRRRNAPPPSFLFVFVGMALAAASLALLAFSSWFPAPEGLVAFARAFFLKGLFLFLVAGIGMKLLPFLMGQGPAPDAAGADSRVRVEPLHLGLVALLLAGLFLESRGLAAYAGPVYSAALLAAGIFRLRLGRFPKAKSALACFVWISCWITALSPLTLAFFPGFAVHFWHLVFLGGFGLLTLFVSLRVVLAHSGQAFLRWEKKPMFFALGGLVLVSMLTRVSAPFFPASLLNHYAYAAAAWILALAGWFFCFFKFTPPFSGSRRQERS
jgi:hypothetical protein